MVTSKATSVKEYLAELPPDRKKTIEAVRKVIKKNLPSGFREGMQYGMISYYVPLSRYPNTYNGQPLAFASLASQKSYMSLYLMCVYGDEDHKAWFERAWTDAGKKLNMGKSCVRFKSLDDVPLDVVGEAVARVSLDDFIAHYEASRGHRKGARPKG